MLAVISCVFSYVSAEHMFTNISKFVAPHGAKLVMHRLSPSVGRFQHLPEEKKYLPGSFRIESSFANSNKNIHSANELVFVLIF